MVYGVWGRGEGLSCLFHPRGAGLAQGVTTLFSSRYNKHCGWFTDPPARPGSEGPFLALFINALCTQERLSALQALHWLPPWPGTFVFQV